MVNKSFFQKLKGGICRIGRNAPWHPSHIIGIRKVKKGESLIDIGCGSAATLECIRDYFFDKEIKYKGTDFIDHRIKWCKEMFPEYEFAVDDATKMNEKDNSWDVVWSRHVLEHVGGVEEPIKEWLRVAKNRVIIVLFNSWCMSDNHEIRHIRWNDDDGKPYECDEYFNSLNKKRMVDFLESLKPEWKYEIIEKIGYRGKPIEGEQYFAPCDIIIHIYK